MIDFLFKVWTIFPLPGWFSAGVDSLSNGRQLSLQVCNRGGKRCIDGGEICITLHQRIQDVFFRRGRIGQGAEYPESSSVDSWGIPTSCVIYLLKAPCSKNWSCLPWAFLLNFSVISALRYIAFHLDQFL